jgi:hypothetical protein
MVEGESGGAAMDNTFPAYSPIRTDVVSATTTARPTEAPVRVHFADVLAGGAQALVAGAQAAVNALPGNPLSAVAIRGSGPGALGATPELGGAHSVSSLTVPASPEGPGASASTGLVNIGGVSVGLGTSTSGTSTSGTSSSGTGTSDPSLDATMAQSQQMNLYYLQVQEEVNAQNRTYTALSNVLEVEHSTAKSAISNIHS